MRTFKKIIAIILVIILILIAGILVARQILMHKGMPSYHEDISLKGLMQPVKVYRDAHAIPHIYAANEHDLYLATGFIMAQERMWQMDLLRRITLGRLSEIFGKDFLQNDIFLRSLQFSAKSEKILSASDSALIGAIEAFADGVNLYIEQDDLPVEFSILGYKPEEWEPKHTINLVSYMAWDLKSGWSELILGRIASKVDRERFAELLPDSLTSRSYVFENDIEELLSHNKTLGMAELEKMGLDIFSGSNVWAVSGSRTTTGKPLLANDMHLSFNMPGIWMQIHQEITGKLNVSGLVLPGAPLIIVGHNDSIAWGMTNTYVDNLDFYEERINPGDSNQYFLDGEWKEFEIFEESFYIKGGEVVKKMIRRNHRGPVVSEVKGITDKVLTIRWIGDVESNELRTIYLVNRAENWDDFRNAFKSFRSISQNIGYADVQGNIGIYCCAGVPIRVRDTIFSVLPGRTSKYDWQGLVPFEELPYEYNPERGYVSAANNNAAGPDYPYHIGTWYALPYRIDRIREMLDLTDKVSPEDIMAMQNDHFSLYSRLLVKMMLQSLNRVTEWNETEKKAIGMLSGWDCNLSAGSSEALITELFSAKLVVNLFSDELGEKLLTEFNNATHSSRLVVDRLLQSGESAWVDDAETETIEKTGDIIVATFKETLSQLTGEYGQDPSRWNWGEVHRITFSHPLSKVKVLELLLDLNKGPYKVPGSSHTVSPFSYRQDDFGNVVHGASHRNIYNLSDWDKSISVIPSGTSGISGSRYYGDQIKMYLEGTYHRDYFGKEIIQSNAVYSMEFRPVKE